MPIFCLNHLPDREYFMLGMGEFDDTMRLSFRCGFYPRPASPGASE
jgi:hypothetical protein